MAAPRRSRSSLRRGQPEVNIVATMSSKRPSTDPNSPGRLRIVTRDGKLSAPLAGVPKVFASGQGGLLDDILDRRFIERARGALENIKAILEEGGSGIDHVLKMTLYLRDFAGPGGELPPSFDPLVEETFADLLQIA